jgi:hypothetical protein
MKLHHVLITPLTSLIIYRNIPVYVKNKADWHLVHVFCGELSATTPHFRCTVSAATSRFEHATACNTDISSATPRDAVRPGSERHATSGGSAGTNFQAIVSHGSSHLA